MKIFMTVIISCTIAITSFTSSAGWLGKSHKQADEVDELLMLVFKSEHKQKPGKYDMRGKCGMREKCDMSRKYGMREKRDMSRKYGKKSHRRDGFGKKAGKHMLKSYLMEKYPKEMAEIITQKKSNDKVMKGTLAKFKALVDKAKADMKVNMQKMKAEHEQFKKMLETYKKNKNPKLAVQIKAKMSSFYDKYCEFMKKRIDQDAARVKKAYDNLKEKKANKDKEISEKLEKMIQ